MDAAQYLLLAVLFLPLLLIMFRGRRQQRDALALQQSLAPGQEVMTTSGLYAKIVDLADDVVVLETGPGQQVRWARAAIARVVRPTTAAGGDPSSGHDVGTEKA